MGHRKEEAKEAPEREKNLKSTEQNDQGIATTVTGKRGNDSQAGSTRRRRKPPQGGVGGRGTAARTKEHVGKPLDGSLYPCFQTPD